MTHREIATIARELTRLPRLDGYVLRHGDILIAEPLRDLVVRGFFFDYPRSGGPAFDFEALVMPLYVPADDVKVGMNRWLGPFWLVEGEEERLVRELSAVLDDGFEHLQSLADYRSIADRAVEVSKYRLGPRFSLEYKAYSLLLANDDAQALDVLREAEAAARIHPRGEPEALRTARVRALMEAEGADAARGQLITWAASTAAHLGVPVESSLLTPPAAPR